MTKSLELPLRDRNALLLAASFAPAYSAGELSHAALTPIRKAIDYILNNHGPFPAFVIDRLWNVAAPPSILFPSVGQAGKAVNAIRMLFEPAPLRDMVDNWKAPARATLLRLRREAARAGGDPEINELIEEASAYVQGGNRLEESAFADGSRMATRIRMGDRVLSTISTVTSFGTALDITVNEIRIELVFPADDETEAFFRALAE